MGLKLVIFAAELMDGSLAVDLLLVPDALFLLPFPGFSELFLNPGNNAILLLNQTLELSIGPFALV
jgi:hypothetical protein